MRVSCCKLRLVSPSTCRLVWMHPAAAVRRVPAPPRCRCCRNPSATGPERRGSGTPTTPWPRTTSQPHRVLVPVPVLMVALALPLALAPVPVPVPVPVPIPRTLTSTPKTLTLTLTPCTTFCQSCPRCGGRPVDRARLRKSCWAAPSGATGRTCTRAATRRPPTCTRPANLTATCAARGRPPCLRNGARATTRPKPTVNNATLPLWRGLAAAQAAKFPPHSGHPSVTAGPGQVAAAAGAAAAAAGVTVVWVALPAGAPVRRPVSVTRTTTRTTRSGTARRCSACSRSIWSGCCSGGSTRCRC